jgi:methionine synthase I (cobalamin-dependent)
VASGFEERLKSGPIMVGDGGMGVLVTGAVPRVRCPEEANLRAPEAVISLHVSFINAGADLIETNTFGANRRKLAGHFLEDEVENINSAGVKLAREAREISGRDVFIAGSIGPLGELTDLSPEYRSRIFKEQAAALAGRGVDLFMVETFFELDELLVAIAAVKEVSSLPVVAMLTFDEQGETLGGVTAKDAIEALSDVGLAAIGANHGAGIQAALTALNEMHATDGGLPLAAMPNIGLASLAGNKVVFPHATPEYFADFAAHARDLGARIIGGCCGTTPVEIAAIAAAVAEERAARSPLVVHEREVTLSVVEVPEETELARRLAAGEWVVSVQLDPPLGGNHRGMLDVARGLEYGGAAFVDINDNATARAGMSALMLSVAIQRATGIETIPHLTTRDSSILGLESQLLGAHAEGIRNVLAVTGDPPEVGDYPGSRGVY